MDKNSVVVEIRAVLATELSTVERVAAMARDEVSSAESKQEGKYDTRATEASYLARGQAWRVAELRRLHAWFSVLEPAAVRDDGIGVGSLVQIEGPRSGWVFVAPVGGPTVTVEGELVRVISPRSPLGAAMTHLLEGDVFEVRSPQGVVDYEVVAAR